MAEQVIALGDKVKHRVIDFKGVVTGRAEYMAGCVRLLVTSKTTKPNGTPLEEWFDEPMLQHTVTRKKTVAKGRGTFGGPQDPGGRNDATRSTTDDDGGTGIEE